MQARTLTLKEIKDQGLVVIGEFGFGGVGDAGLIVAPEGKVASVVQRYYDSDDTGENLQEQIERFKKLGGEFVYEG